MKIILLTNNISWKSLKRRTKEVEKELDFRYRPSEGSVTTISIVPCSLPQPFMTFDKYLDQAWFMQETQKLGVRKGNDCIGLLVSKKQWKSWGGTLGASAFYMPDSVATDHKLDFVLICDEHDTYETPDGKIHRKYEYIFAHEIAHAKSLDIGLKLNPDNEWHLTPYVEGYDNTHHFFFRGDIAGFYNDFNKHWKIKSNAMYYFLNNVQNVIWSLNFLSKVTPLEKRWWDNVSQHYGVKNSIYTKTGYHIGTDFACPVGTQVRARGAGEITKVGTDKVLGNYCYFKVGKYEDRYLHLDKVPTLGKYKKGDVIAITGNTGMSTGPHLHLDVWKGSVNVDKINKKNWSELTIDPRSL